MKTRFPMAPLAAAVFLLCASAAEAGVLVPLPKVPGSVNTYAIAINNNNVIAGRYVTADGLNHGFFGTLDGNYTTFDAPGGQAVASGINDEGYILGFAATSEIKTDGCPIFGCQFLRKPDGTILMIKKDGKRLDGLPGQLAEHQKFVGNYEYIGGDGYYHYSGYYGHGSKYLSDMISPFGSDFPVPDGLSRDGTVTGWFSDPVITLENHGFVLKNGVVTAYDYPDQNAFRTQFNQTNNKGLTAGMWDDQLQEAWYAFIFDISSARFEPIDVPGAANAIATGINDAGITTINADEAPYIYCPHKKTCPLQAGAIEVPEHWIAARSIAIRASSQNRAPVTQRDRHLFRESGLSLRR